MVTPPRVLVGGDALFDFISTRTGLGLGQSTSFDKRAGGSQFNVAVGIRRLGIPTAFVSAPQKRLRLVQKWRHFWPNSN